MQIQDYKKNNIDENVKRTFDFNERVLTASRVCDRNYCLLENIKIDLKDIINLFIFFCAFNLFQNPKF